MKITNAIKLAFSCCILCLSISSCFGQLKDSEKANIVVSMDFDALRSDAMVKKFELEKKIRKALGPSNDLDVKSIFVAARLTESFQDVKDFVSSLGPGGPPESVPFEYVQKIVFIDDESFEKMASQTPVFFQKKTVGDKIYLTPPEGQLTNVLIILDKKNKTFVLGTKRFASALGGDLMEPGLKKIWANISKDRSIRIAVNLKSSRKFITDFCDFSKELGPMVSLQVQVLKSIDHLVVHANPSTDQVLKMEVACTDSKEAQKLQRQLNGYLGMFKMGFSSLDRSPIFEEKKLKDFLVDTKRQLEFQKDGSNLTLAYQKPEGFNEIVATLVAKGDEARKKLEEINRFKMAALAVHMHHDSFKRFPFRYQSNGIAHKNLSWRMKICQFTDAKRLYDSAAPGKAWDDPKNKRYQNQMPADLGSNNSHSDICWIESKVKGFRDIVDGTSNTIMFVQNPAGVPWLQVKDLTPEQAVKLVRGLKDGQQLIVGFYDGSVSKVSNKIKEKDLRALLTPAGGEIVNRSEILRSR